MAAAAAVAEGAEVAAVVEVEAAVVEVEAAAVEVEAAAVEAAAAVVVAAEVEAVAVAAEVEVAEFQTGEAPRADRQRCSGPVWWSLSHLPWGPRWIERAMRPCWRGPSPDSASAHRRAPSSRGGA